MTKFIFKLFIISTILLSLHYFLGVHINKNVLENTLEDKIVERFIDEGYDKEIFIFGDSHPQNAIYPDVFDNSFNFSSSGEPYRDSLSKIEYLLRKKDDVETVIIPFDMQTFVPFRVSSCRDNWPYYEYDDLFDRLSSYAKRDTDACMNSVFPHWGNFTIIRKSIRYFTRKDVPIKDKDKDIDNDLWDDRLIAHGIVLKTPKTEDDVLENIRLKKEFIEKNSLYMVQDRHFFNSEVLDPIMIRHFEDTIELLQANDIKIVIVKYPVADVYIQYAEEEVDFSGLYEYEDEIRIKYPNISWIDLREWENDNYEYFRDADHLSKLGAIEFSKELKRMIETLN